MGLERLAGCLLLMQFSIAAPASQLSTVSSLIQQYPRSDQVQFKEEKEVETHEIMLGALKKSGGIVRPEASTFVAGRRAARTWYIPNEQRTGVVAEFFENQLSSLGDILYKCKGYECGSSNYWANNVFGEEVLYGPEENQRYFVTKVTRPDATYYVAVYIALRGTRKLYAHTDITIVEPEKKEVGAGSIAQALNSKRKYVIDAGDEDRLLPGVADALRIEPTFRIAVVRHSRRQRGESVPQAVARSEQTAKKYAARLIAAGIDPSRVQAYGVGPLVPLDGVIVDRIEIVLIGSD